LPTAAVAAAGCALLALRPWLIQRHAHDQQLVVLFIVLGVVGYAWPLGSEQRVPWRRVATVTVFGVGAFALGRFLGGGIAPARTTMTIVALDALAAVSEELFFRRFVYGALEHRGPLVAIGVSGIAFAFVHLTIYGGWAMPLDIGAGLLLSWQRWATGSWRASGLTHVAANLLAVLP
jgi:membrane protease YdiL (CAAX protease family)